MKWYQKPLWIIVLLFLFFPVGLFLMWKYSNWSKQAKWAVTGAFAVFVVLLALTTPSEPTNQETVSNSVSEKVATMSAEEKAAQEAAAKKKAEEEAKKKADEEAKKKAQEEASKTLDEFPKKLEDYLNNTWDEIPGTTYKVYWWDTWEGVDSGKNDLVVEPSFEPSEKQCQRIAQVATLARVNWIGREEGVVHIVAYDNSKDYCKLRTP